MIARQICNNHKLFIMAMIRKILSVLSIRRIIHKILHEVPRFTLKSFIKLGRVERHFAIISLTERKPRLKLWIIILKIKIFLDLFPKVDQNRKICCVIIRTVKHMTHFVIIQMTCYLFVFTIVNSVYSW